MNNKYTSAWQYFVETEANGETDSTDITPGIENLLPEVNGLIESYGGYSSLSNPFIMVRIQEELQKTCPNIADAELAQVRDYMNMKK